MGRFFSPAIKSNFGLKKILVFCFLLLRTERRYLTEYCCCPGYTQVAGSPGCPKGLYSLLNAPPPLLPTSLRPNVNYVDNFELGAKENCGIDFMFVWYYMAAFGHWLKNLNLSGAKAELACTNFPALFANCINQLPYNPFIHSCSVFSIFLLTDS